MIVDVALDLAKARRSVFCAALALQAVAFAQAIPQTGDWPAYGRDPGASRYSPLDQINSKNVSKLQRAWTYHTQERERSFESIPIVVGNVMYLTTHTQKVIALDPETGRELWRFDAKAPGRENRGVSYWPGDRETPPRILLGTGDGRLIALDAKTGAPIPSFGDNGVVNLRAGITEKSPKPPTASHPHRRSIATWRLSDQALRRALRTGRAAIRARSMCGPESCAGASTPCRCRASRVVRPGHPMAGRTARGRVSGASPPSIGSEA